MAEEEEVDLDGNVGEEGVRVEVSEEDAIVELCFRNRVNWVVAWVKSTKMDMDKGTRQPWSYVRGAPRRRLSVRHVVSFCLYKRECRLGAT